MSFFIYMTDTRTMFALFATRLALGWLFFYAGITKVFNPEWSSKAYLLSAKSFAAFYHALASAPVLPWVDLLNKWGLVLLGICLITGIWIRVGATLGIALMLLYYLPVLDFPYVSKGFIIDEHVVYGLLLAVFVAQSAPLKQNGPRQWLLHVIQFLLAGKLPIYEQK